ncbi:MAG: N-acetylmuramoyl-L-alanine amidase [Azospirillaceae bacterium]|nr:N-acetylmuramoyl-L-alanine amidase [Azospirillaceae bacterium]
MAKVGSVSPQRRALLRLALTAPFLGVAITIPGIAAAEPASLTSRKPRSALLDRAGALIRPGTKPQVPEALTRRPRVVVIDPGHGGHDPGTIGGRGTYEKAVTLDLCQTIQRQLSHHPGIKVRLTRNQDEFIALDDRVAIAEHAKADLFISIHADSAPNREARGLSVYTLAEHGTDALAAALAQRENGPGGFVIPVVDAQVAAVLQKLVVRQTRNSSLQTQAAIVDGCGRHLRLLENPMRAANFAVLRAPDIPSVLIETGFLSNRDDETLLADPRSRRNVAEVLAEEIAALVDRPMFA